MQYRNLLKETKSLVRGRPVLWCGSPDWGWFTWEEFCELADREYDAGYGGEEVAEDLIVVGDDCWLERHSYDGAEWWEEKKMPVKPKGHRVPPGLFPPFPDVLAVFDEEEV